MVESEGPMNGLEHHYRTIESYMLRFSQKQKLTRIDHINYRVAIREVNLHFAGEAFKREDYMYYRRYNKVAEECNNQIIGFQLDFGKPRTRRGGLRDFSGLRRKIASNITQQRRFSKSLSS